VRAFEILAAASLIGTLAACRDATGPRSDVLTVDAGPVPGVLRLQNRTGEPVYYFVVERETLAVIDFLLCTDPSCPSVPPHGEVKLPYGRITGYHERAKEAVMFHWHLRAKAGGGFVADSVRTLVVRL